MNDKVLDPSIAPLVDEVEKDLLHHIIEGLKQKKIPLPEAQKLARDFLRVLPIKDKHDLLLKLKEVSQMHPEVFDVYFKLANEHEENVREKKLSLAAQHIQQGNIEQALQAVKGGQNA